MKSTVLNFLSALVLQDKRARSTVERFLCRALCITLFALTAHASPATITAKSGLKLAFPSDSFALVDPTPGGVELALRHIGASAFPTLNIIVRPGSWDPTRLSALNEGEAVVASYRKLGLTDARLVSSRTTVVGGTSAAAFTISYASQGVLFRAQVLLIPGSDRHYIATILAKEGEDDAAEALLIQTIEAGLELPAGGTGSPSGTLTSTPSLWLWGLLIGAAVVGVLWWTGRRNGVTRKSAE